MGYKGLSPRRKFVFCLDILLFTLFVLCLSPLLTGLPMHEIIGAFIFFPVLIHILIEWKWFANYFRRFFKNAGSRDKFNLLLNSLLFTALVFQVISGLMISQVLLPFFHIKTIDAERWRLWHNKTSTVTMFLVGFHLALSFKRIVSYFKKSKNYPPAKKRKISIDIKLLLYRIFIICVLTCIIAIAAVLILGKPLPDHGYTIDEISRFHSTVLNGILQLAGETLFVILTCLIASKWLRVRL